MKYTVKIWMRSKGNSPRGTNFGTLLPEGPITDPIFGEGKVQNEYGSLQANSYHVFEGVSLEQIHEAVKASQRFNVYVGEEGIAHWGGLHSMIDAHYCEHASRVLSACQNMEAMKFPFKRDGLWEISAPGWEKAAYASSEAAANEWIARKRQAAECFRNIEYSARKMNPEEMPGLFFSFAESALKTFYPS